LPRILQRTLRLLLQPEQRGSRSLPVKRSSLSTDTTTTNQTVLPADAGQGRSHLYFRRLRSSFSRTSRRANRRRRDLDNKVRKASIYATHPTNAYTTNPNAINADAAGHPFPGIRSHDAHAGKRQGPTPTIGTDASVIESKCATHQKPVLAAVLGHQVNVR
jgi:hypothetical protein